MTPPKWFSRCTTWPRNIKRRTRKLMLLPEIFLALASPCENRDTSLCQSRRHLVLGGVDVARGPPHLDGGQSESSQLDLYSTWAPRQRRVSTSTAVWALMCVHPTMRACLRGWSSFALCLRGRGVYSSQKLSFFINHYLEHWVFL